MNDWIKTDSCRVEPQSLVDPVVSGFHPPDRSSK
jgi:hypothetical protein